MPASSRIHQALLAGVAGLMLCLAGCAPEPQPTPTTPAPTPTASAPVLLPDGTAAENLPYFTQVVEQVWNSPDQVSGRAYVDALAAAGFDKAAMQVTPDESTVGNPAETIQFSVLWQGECLLGQVGPATGGVVTTVGATVLGGTACLIGNTRPIDW